ncbi:MULTISPECIES: cytochrome d ubiquinol oxidase subunit II [Desulfovibrio]|jgi:cytochrome d ubiquinol oxidase subunit II|uniref:cytochrome d ubiquinol oxidase subunit II n=1 Tax=Desulfovibrio TaxID=872 RepID=UPI00195E3E40|nr:MULTISPECIES: cytochrome d ubiquinol oxidase subunit II [Desulfovibrio]MBM6836228.1 cytochrome d ubiquinol oxidase subunit II [Desulfovibrio piger]MBM6895350.1 cytochrome d ubiquinol oxidase subunit II [Desulfovibrio piger]MBS5807050.1 cytochrome d ubiquinol oxidase subunit II [Desulfovibrio piger]MCI6332464.1 cytochrome d ubiquinol oxidase subunit II [Desulfovibrio piger]MCI7406668.1 cytochrome d ubiquinol oxidase subunit II [Desulfovibrio piger]
MLETLQVIWFILWALLWAVYFVLDGFDLGLGSLLPFIGSNEEERRIMYNAAGPFWDGNEVWLISAGGVTFAAFPKVYAVMFSALYAPLLILLFALIFRAVSFEFRGKVESGVWRGFWDLVHFLSNLVPSLLLGVTFANLFMGIPIDGEGVFHGTLMGLVNGYGIAGAIFFLVMFMLHGSLWLAIKSQGELQTRAVASATLLWPVMLILLVAFLVLTFFNTDLFSNYWSNPLLLLLPVVALAGLLGVRCMLRRGQLWKAWMCSAVYIIGVTFFGVMGMFPRMLISSIDPTATLTAFNASSSELTLKIMLGVALVMVPIVLLYQFWVYRLFSHSLSAEDLKDEHAY